jgi:isoquinoline 1-oxidoreductase beta subunit
MKVSGVEKVMEVKGWPWPSKFQPLGGVAVIARRTGAAIKGRDALKIVWDDGANGKYESVAYRAGPAPGSPAWWCARKVTLTPP